jgi:SAM-dependent methyltransferase
VLTEWHDAGSIAGLNLKKLLLSARGVPAFVADYIRYHRAASTNGLPIRLSQLCPVLPDRYERAGTARGHYFFQDLWAAKKIYATKPARHVDIGSSVAGFISHLLVFMDQVEMIDIRSLPSTIPGLVFVQDDATVLGMFEDNSLPSVSSLHAAEHFGLGRYGDRIDPDAHLKFMRALVRVLKPDGRLYFSVPTGIERLAFNAHRVISPKTVMNVFSELELVSFAAVKDDGYLSEDATLDEAARLAYGCGLYEFTKH